MEGTHRNTITKVASANLTKGTIVKLTSADSNKIEAAGASDTNAIGVVLDDVNSGDNVAVGLLGVNDSTMLMIASGAISEGARVVQDASGKVKTYPAATTTDQNVLVVGIALTKAIANGNPLEVAHRAPVAEVVEKTT